MHLLLLAEEVKKGVEEAGLVGFRFNTVGVSDAISMGTNGMSYSLQSRCAHGPPQLHLAARPCPAMVNSLQHWPPDTACSTSPT